VNVAPHHLRDGRVNQPVPLACGHASELFRHDSDPVVPTFARTGVPRVQMAVVAYVQLHRLERCDQNGTQAIDSGEGRCGLPPGRFRFRQKAYFESRYRSL
jgi:hypothetical protein